MKKIENSFIIKKKILLSKNAFSGSEILDGIDFSFYCAEGGKTHEVFLSAKNAAPIKELIDNHYTDYKTLAKNGVASLYSLEHDGTPLPFMYQYYIPENCKNHYLIIFRSGEWQNGFYSCGIDAVLQIEKNEN